LTAFIQYRYLNAALGYIKEMVVISSGVLGGWLKTFYRWMTWRMSPKCPEIMSSLMMMMIAL